MNNPTFEIYGTERRKQKKTLAELKRFVNQFWHYEDIDRAHGGGLSDEECNEILAKSQLEIEQLEEKLSKRFLAK